MKQKTRQEKATDDAVHKLSAIAHTGRLSLLRRLIQADSDSITAGELARQEKLAPSTASAQLLVLANADLVSDKRDGRQVIYTANYQAMTGLLSFLMHNCCGSRRDICSPAIKEPK